MSELFNYLSIIYLKDEERTTTKRLSCLRSEMQQLRSTKSFRESLFTKEEFAGERTNTRPDSSDEDSREFVAALK